MLPGLAGVLLGLPEHRQVKVQNSRSEKDGHKQEQDG